MNTLKIPFIVPIYWPTAIVKYIWSFRGKQYFIYMIPGLSKFDYQTVPVC